MSSILEALKKAEQESAAGHGQGPSFPPRLSQATPHRKARYWRWTILSIVGLAVGAMVVWQIRRSTAPMSVAPITAQVQQSGSTPPAAVNQHKQPLKPLPAETSSRPSLPPPKPAPIKKTPPLVRSAPSVSSVAQPVRKPLPMDAPVQTAPEKAAPWPQGDRQGDTAIAVSATTPAEKSTSGTAASDTTVDQSPDMLNANKQFRNDPRIELQALVWAPEAASRFVVINNRLVKEGGSFDNIVVVKINRDDVLLSEGADRWYEKFKVR